MRNGVSPALPRRRSTLVMATPGEACGLMAAGTKALLSGLGTVLKVFRRGTRAAAAAEGRWRPAKLRTARTAQGWVSRGAVGSEASQSGRSCAWVASASQKMVSFHLTSCALPHERFIQGPMAAAYTREGVVVATDGSPKHLGTMMGAASVALGNRRSLPAVWLCSAPRCPSFPSYPE